MTVVPWGSANVDLTAGGLWEMVVVVYDANHVPVDVAPVFTVTLPDGSTATPVPAEEAYGWRVLYEVTEPGRYVARAVVAGHGVADFTVWVSAVVPAAGMPDLTDVDDYIGEHSWTDGELQSALDAEAAAQRRCCTIPAAYPADLREALLRRVARNLSMRRLTLSVQRGDNDAGETTILPGRDPEVRRFEKNYPKLGVG